MHGRYFNPDDYLETSTGRVFTPERSAVAFERAYEDLESALRRASPDARLFLVVGVQGAGKTTWVQQHADALGGSAFFFDAALPRAVHRARALSIARACGVPAVAVWVQAPLEVALTRNQLRRADHRVPDAAIHSVHSMMEPPSISEGFVEVQKASAPTRS